MRHHFTKIIENKAPTKQSELQNYRMTNTTVITYKDANTPSPKYFVLACFLNADTMSDAAAEAVERNLTVLQVLTPVFDAMFQDTTYRPATMVRSVHNSFETGIELCEDVASFEDIPTDARYTGFMGSCYGREYIHLVYKLLHADIEKISATVTV